MQAIEELEKALEHLEAAEGELTQIKKSPPAWDAFFIVSDVCVGVRIALSLLKQEKEE